MLDPQGDEDEVTCNCPHERNFDQRTVKVFIIAKQQEKLTRCPYTHICIQEARTLNSPTYTQHSHAYYINIFSRELSVV
jgi:hypothetical protein